MRISTRLFAFVVLGGVLALAGCGASPGTSLTAPVIGAIDDGTITSSGNAAASSPSVLNAGECDGTALGRGPGNGGGSGPGAPGDGVCSGTVGPDPADIGAMLEGALQEEYKAQMLYQSVLEDFPGALPFAYIVESEARHVEAIQGLFTRRALTPPASQWAPGSFSAFDSLPLACAAGVEAERADAAFYAPYLQRTDLPQDVLNVFTNLQTASLESHLPAFERCR